MAKKDEVTGKTPRPFTQLDTHDVKAYQVIVPANKETKEK